MESFEALRGQATRLAALLGDAPGTQILAELHKVSRAAPSTEPVADGRRDEPAGSLVGAWRAEPSSAGVALRRTRERPAFPEWNERDYVPPAGAARRVVLIGESTARGWPLASEHSPAEVLQHGLDATAAGAYQSVDLSKIGASTDDLIAVLTQAPVARPDVVVAFAGNNWSLPPEEAELRAPLEGGDSLADRLADELARSGYGAMREQFLSLVVLGRARRFCAGLRSLQARTRARVVVVIPEFDLRGWHPPTDTALPALPGPDLARWHALRARAERAASAARLEEVQDLVDQMRTLDRGTSPVPGELLGRLAESLGEGALARRELEQARDAACGTFLRHTPRVTRGVQRLLADFAAKQGYECVDLRHHLAGRDLPDLPDPAYFHDYCHLTEAGVEKAMAAVGDAVAGAPTGTTRAGPPAPAQARAFTQAHAAAHLSLQGQPAQVVIGRLRAALDADPGLTGLMRAVRDLLADPRPAWIAPAAATLAELDPLRPFVIPTAMSKALSPQLWMLRDCLDQVVGPPPASGDPSADDPLPATVDLLAAPETGGHVGVSWRSGTSYLRASCRQSPLAFSLRDPRALTVTLTYRMPGADPGHRADVSCNGTPIARLGSSRAWTRTRVEVPRDLTRPGVNWLRVTWPVPTPTGPDADVAALRRGEFPAVASVYGEVFEAVLDQSGQPGGGRTDLP